MYLNRNKAAKVLNVTVDKLRGMEKRGEIETRKAKNGHIEIKVDDSLCNMLSDDERLKKAKADLAELKLADMRGELAKKYVNMLLDCFIEALPIYREALQELDLKKSDIENLNNALDRFIARIRENVIETLNGNTNKNQDQIEGENENE